MLHIVALPPPSGFSRFLVISAARQTPSSSSRSSRHCHSIGRRHKSRCLGVAIFYSSKRFEKTAELRVVFSEEARGLRVGSDRKRRRRSDGGGMSEPLEAPAASTRARARKGAADSSDSLSDQFLRRVYGGDTGTGGPDGREDPATASRLEQDLEDKHDAAALVRLRLKEDGGLGEGGGTASGQRARAITVGCAHLFYDPRRPDLKTAQCQMLFQAIDRFHKKCGVAGALSDGAGTPLTPANLILCADFNSKPVMDTRFLPGPLKVSAAIQIQPFLTPVRLIPTRVTRCLSPFAVLMGNAYTPLVRRCLKRIGSHSLSLDSASTCHD